MMQARGDKIPDEQLAEMIDNVIKTLAVEKINVSHLDLSQQLGERSTGNVQDDFNDNEADRDRIVSALSDSFAGLTMDIVHRAQDLDIDFDLLEKIKRELIRLACSTQKDKFVFNVTEDK